MSPRIDEIVCYRNEYRMKDGAQRFGLPCWTRDQAVLAGAEVQGVTGALVVFRWRIAVRLPDVMSETTMPDDPKPLPPPRYRTPAGFGLGNWIWRKFVAPFFGG